MSSQIMAVQFRVCKVPPFSFFFSPFLHFVPPRICGDFYLLDCFPCLLGRGETLEEVVAEASFFPLSVCCACASRGVHHMIEAIKVDRLGMRGRRAVIVLAWLVATSGGVVLLSVGCAKLWSRSTRKRYTWRRAARHGTVLCALFVQWERK